MQNLFEFLVELRVSSPGILDLLFVFRFAGLQILVNRLLIRKIESDCTVDLLETHRRKRPGNQLGRSALHKLIHDRVEGHAATCDVVAAVSSLNILFDNYHYGNSVPKSPAFAEVRLRSALTTDHPCPPPPV